MTTTTRKSCASSAVAPQPLRRASETTACCGGVGVAPTVHITEGMSKHDATAGGNDRLTSQPLFRWGLGIFVAVALFFLWEEHRAHLLGALPWLLLLACPLMHMLMHRRHHHDHATHPVDPNDKKEHSSHGCC